jgi:hypothetical protein
MSESQSRYKIVEEMNNRKINQKEKLANIERAIAETEQEIKEQEDSYELEFRDRQREMKVTLDLATSEFERKKAKIEKAMVDDEANYESNFQSWKQYIQT